METRREFLEICIGAVVSASIVGKTVGITESSGTPYLLFPAGDRQEPIKRFIATILKVDVPNKNNRIYPREVVRKALEEMGDSPLLGCIGFQDGTIKVPFARVSHQATNLRLDGFGVKADITILDTEQGKVLQQLLQNENAVAFRTGGVGSATEKDGVLVIDDNFKFTTVAAVPAKDAS